MARFYRFFTTDTDCEGLSGDLILNDKREGEIFNQLVKVLRVKTGDRIVLLCGDLFEYSYEIVLAYKKEVQLRFLNKKLNDNELDFNLGLILCLPNKPDKLALILQKAVELGVSEVVLVDGEFSQMKHELKEDRLRKIMKEASEQSERGKISELNVEGELLDFLNGDWVRQKSANIFVAMEREDLRGLNETLKNWDAGEGLKDVYILVGPEGGFSEGEKIALRDHQIESFSLGKRILRMETAAIVALGIAALR